MSYIAANGQEITEAMIELWCDAYDRDEFPGGTARSVAWSWAVPQCPQTKP